MILTFPVVSQFHCNILPRGLYLALREMTEANAFCPTFEIIDILAASFRVS